MRNLMIASFIIALSLSFRAQERIVLDANLAQQRLDIPIVGGTTTAPPVRGVVDGPPAAPPLLELSIETLKAEPQSTATPGSKQVDYVIRLTNRSNKPKEIPVNPDRNKVIHECHSAPQLEAAISMNSKSGAEQEHVLPSTSTWSGCHEMSGSLIRLMPGEWISYRGSIDIPSNQITSTTAVGHWLISRVSYVKTADRLMEQSKGEIQLNSNSRTIEH
jgi:hypothetical protein